MGTEKRERQKANRQLRLEELARQQQKQQMKRRGLRIGMLVAGVIALTFIVFLLNRGKSTKENQAAATTVPAVGDSTPPISVDTATTVVDPNATPAPTVPFTTVAAVPWTYGAGECPAADGSSKQTQQFDKAFNQCIDAAKTYSATIETNKGNLEVALESGDYPGTVNNFVALSRFHYYDNTVCHRIIKGFVVQCGRPGGQEAEGRPGYTINEEIPKRAYKIGDVVMAKTSAPNSTGGQIFIVTGDQGVALPPEYSIVGSITTGLDVASKMEAAANPAQDTAPLEEIKITKVTITES